MLASTPMRALVGVVAVWGLSCVGSQVQVLPSLTPVDASRPFFVFKPVEGNACGGNAAARAMEDLYRIAGDSDGFVSATIETKPDGCVTISARPISYGCTPREPLKLEQYPMQVRPGPPTCEAVVDRCLTDCAASAKTLDGGEFAISARRERCVSSCRNPDAGSVP